MNSGKPSFQFAVHHPHPRLSELVNHYLWIRGDEYFNPVFLPDTINVIIFQLAGQVNETNHPGQKPLSGTRISGSFSVKRNFQPQAQFEVLMAILKPYALYTLIGINMEPLNNEIIDLANILGRKQVELLERRLASVTDLRMKINLVEAFLYQKLSAARRSETTVKEALQLIDRTGGLLPSPEIARQVHVSQRTLERHFNEVVGLNVKKFSSLVRMKMAVAQVALDIPYSRIIYEGDFFDQSHFIRNFKQYTGMAPRHFARTGLLSSKVVDFLQLYLNTLG
ncbi:MAG: helix-turn-helix domain-containing protein [Saprospiraceae bacterium]